MSYIKSVLEYARLTLNLPVTGRIIDDARQQMEKMNLVGKSQHRNRRPAADELEMMLAGLRERAQSGNGFIPTAAIVEFSIYSAMRISEVCRLRWDDIDEVARTVIIRQRKDPKKKAHNDQVVPLLGPAWDIAMAQPRIEERIFPYDPRSVSAAWQRVRAKLGIDDLRFHDLRHEGTSRLFELGYGIHEVSMVNGNRSWSSLKRYTNLKPSALHEKYGQLLAAADPASDPQPVPAKIKRRQWLVSTPDGWLYPVDGEIGFVDDESDAFGWPDEKSAQTARPLLFCPSALFVNVLCQIVDMHEDRRLVAVRHPDCRNRECVEIGAQAPPPPPLLSPK
nr:site-specific integrase [Laribacter hongkongensis]